MSHLVVAGLFVLLVLVGSRLGCWLVADDGGPIDRLVLFPVAGLVVVHVGLLGLSLLGVPWTPATLGAVAVVYAVTTWRSARSPLDADRLRRLGRDLGWGDGVAGVAVAVFYLFAVRHWIVFPDFVYHWGLKAKRFLHAGGIDFALLSDPAHWFLHRDYPTLLPELYALTGLLRGHFTERGAMLWSVVFLVLLVLAARRAMAEIGTPRRIAQYGVATVALVAAGFGIGYSLAGSADWLMALSLILALVPLAASPGPGRDGELALAASLAVAAKVEGTALAVILVAVHLVRRRVGDRRELLPAAVRVAGPPAVVAALWWGPVIRFDLAEGYYAGSWAWERVPAAAEAMLRALLVPEWVGIPVLVLVLLVAVTFRSRSRPFAAVCWLQLGFVAFAYLVAPVDTATLVASSFPRLLFHLAPALLVIGVVEVVGTGREGQMENGGEKRKRDERREESARP